ncbi:MAG TPA: hypothetical protein VGG32_06495 [Thermoplasmata archaeon]
MRAQPNAAVRRFTAVWGVSIAVRLAALAVLLLVVMKLLGGL